MSASLAGAAEVDDQLTPVSSCGLLEAQERLAKGLGCRWILGLSLEVENWGRRGVCCSVCLEEDGWLARFCLRDAWVLLGIAGEWQVL